MLAMREALGAAEGEQAAVPEHWVALMGVAREATRAAEGMAAVAAAREAPRAAAAGPRAAVAVAWGIPLGCTAGTTAVGGMVAAAAVVAVAKGLAGVAMGSAEVMATVTARWVAAAVVAMERAGSSAV